MEDMTLEAILRHQNEEHAAEIARLTAALAEAVRAKECFQRMTRAHWEALCAMRNSINEYVPMPNTDSGPLFSPENGPIYADISERVIAALAEAEARTAALVAEAYEAAVEAIEALPRRQEPIGGQMVSYVQIAEAITAIRALAQKEAGE